MKILSSTIEFEATHQLQVSQQESEKLQVWDGSGDAKTINNPGFAGKSAIDDSLQISPSAEKLFKQLAKSDHPKPHRNLNARPASGSEDISLEISPEDKQKLLILEKLWERLTGKKISLHIVSGKNFKKPKHDHGVRTANGQSQEPGLEYEYHERYHEQEKMAFTADGVIKTADNREIDFSVALRMSREFSQSLDITAKTGGGGAKLTDPLVINYDGSAVGLSEKKFAFDLDTDGNEEQLSRLKTGNGFLALDRNNDGVINNGRELFGPTSGSGFQELARFDEDGNDWIDENDSVFDRLRIWSMDDSGQSSLFALSQKNIGAIYLGQHETPFQLKDNQNQLLGQVRSTGIYLQEQGAVGIVQQVDLVS